MKKCIPLDHIKCIRRIHHQNCFWRLIFIYFMYCVYKWFASSFLPSIDLRLTNCWYYILPNVWYNHFTSYLVQNPANSNWSKYSILVDEDGSFVVQNFLTTSANILHKLFEMLPNWFDVKLLFQPSWSRPEVPAAPVVLSIAFFTLFASIEWNLIG